MKTISTLFISFILVTFASTANATNTPGSNNKATAVSNLTVGATNDAVVLTWSTSQVGKSSFEVERSFYSNEFTTIATLQVSNRKINTYRVSDNATELAGRSIAYYRVKFTAANGTISYSDVTVVNLSNIENTAGNTTNNKTISFNAPQNGNASIRINSLTGQTIATSSTIISKGNNTVALPNTEAVAKGMYVSEVLVNGIVVATQKVIVE